ncbi:transposable element Tcb1 transposase [Trichonephila clavipes]|nr:transposable element Tcb1 transposase [Trichonephila clavipes]
MDDNVRPYRVDIWSVWVSEGIARKAWPTYSPDLIPIENLWDALVRAVSSRSPPPATLIELETALHEEWRLLNSAVVDHPIESMDKIVLKLLSSEKEFEDSTLKTGETGNLKAN